MTLLLRINSYFFAIFINNLQIFTITYKHQILINFIFISCFNDFKSTIIMPLIFTSFIILAVRIHKKKRSI